jgi:hypothetical protein
MIITSTTESYLVAAFDRLLQKPFELPPSGIDLYDRFEVWIVKSEIRRSTADMGDNESGTSLLEL